MEYLTMALLINTNISSLNAQRNLSRTQNELTTSIQRLSSGLRVNSAKDDAAGMFLIENMTADIRGLRQASRNAADGISVGQTAEAALGKIGENVQRIREIAVQSANDSVSDAARSGLQKEVDQLTQEISRIVATTEFNGTSLLSGSSSTLNFQVGQDGQSNNQVSLSTVQLSQAGSAGLHTFSSSLTATGVVNVTSQANASAAISNLDTDISTISTNRSTFGAVQNRFEAVISNLDSYAEQLAAARSRIQDADFAAETAALTRAQILQQAGTAMVSQANALPQTALSLLQ
jgi:flagellin